MRSTRVKRVSLFLLTIAVLTVPALALEPVRDDPPPPWGGGGGGSTCSYCSQAQCGCAPPPVGYILYFSCACGGGAGGTCTQTCNYQPR